MVAPLFISRLSTSAVTRGYPLCQANHKKRDLYANRGCGRGDILKYVHSLS